MLLEGKQILVTGIANEKSIAWGIAKSLNKQGAKLLFTYRKEKSRRKLQKMLTDAEIEPVCIVACDVLNDDSISEAFNFIKQHIGRIDGVVHSLAYASIEALHGDCIDISREDFLEALSASTYSLISFCKHAREVMTEGGSVVTQTYLGSERAVDNYSVMGIAKAALEATVRYLSVDLGKLGIRVNAVSSGVIKTSASSVIPGLDEKLLNVAERSPLKKNVTLEEIGDTSMFLMSSLSKGITGEIIFVDSGFHVLG
ncbi:enoyl-ACP reductase [Paenibacillus sp. FSL R5-0490]|uniref:enoyl-ACP reductase FabI n=1 Tax=Paenibacillus sp. FSL R5-0490 TaxID=1920424 RepID=UPI0030CC67A7